MKNEIYVYDPSQVQVSTGETVWDGFADGDFITINKVQGATTTVRCLTPERIAFLKESNEVYEITINMFRATRFVRALLSAIHNNRHSMFAATPLTITDNSTGQIFTFMAVLIGWQDISIGTDVPQLQIKFTAGSYHYQQAQATGRSKSALDIAAEAVNSVSKFVNKTISGIFS